MGFLRSFGDKKAGRGDIGVRGDGKGEVGTEMDFEEEERDRGLNLKRLEMLERLELYKEGQFFFDCKWRSKRDSEDIGVGGWRTEGDSRFVRTRIVDRWRLASCYAEYEGVAFEQCGDGSRWSRSRLGMTATAFTPRVVLRGFGFLASLVGELHHPPSGL